MESHWEQCKRSVVKMVNNVLLLANSKSDCHCRFYTIPRQVITLLECQSQMAWHPTQPDDSNAWRHPVEGVDLCSGS